MDPLQHPGVRLRTFRETRKISLRDAARQLHTVHPALKDWEEGQQVPTSPNRDAIEVWTEGEIKADEWPLSARERDLISNAAKVVPAVSKTPTPAPASAPAVPDATQTQDELPASEHASGTSATAPDATREPTGT